MNIRILAEIIIIFVAIWLFFKFFFFRFMPHFVKETLKTRRAAKTYDEQLKGEKDGEVETGRTELSKD